MRHHRATDCGLETRGRRHAKRRALARGGRIGSHKRGILKDHATLRMRSESERDEQPVNAARRARGKAPDHIGTTWAAPRFSYVERGRGVSGCVGSIRWEVDGRDRDRNLGRIANEHCHVCSSPRKQRIAGRAACAQVERDRSGGRGDPRSDGAEKRHQHGRCANRNAAGGGTRDCACKQNGPGPSHDSSDVRYMRNDCTGIDIGRRIAKDKTAIKSRGAGDVVSSRYPAGTAVNGHSPGRRSVASRANQTAVGELTTVVLAPRRRTEASARLPESEGEEHSGDNRT